MSIEFSKGTGRDSDKFMLRFPDGMRDRIAEAAKANNRSMNAEIVARLEGSFKPADDSQVVVDQARQIFDLRRELALVHMGMVMPRVYIKDHSYREEALRDINQAMTRTGPHAQWLMDLTLDELNAQRVQMGYAPLKPEEFTGVYKTSAQRDAAKAAGASYFAANPDG